MGTHTPATSAAIAVSTLKRNHNFIDCHPSVLVDPFYHDAASTFTVVFGTAVPEAFHRLPCFSIIASVNNIFLCPSDSMLAQRSAS